MRIGSINPIHKITNLRGGETLRRASPGLYCWNVTVNRHWRLSQCGLQRHEGCRASETLWACAVTLTAERGVRRAAEASTYWVTAAHGTVEIGVCARLVGVNWVWVWE